MKFESSDKPMGLPWKGGRYICMSKQRSDLTKVLLWALRSFIVMSSGYHMEEMFTRDSKAAN